MRTCLYSPLELLSKIIAPAALAAFVVLGGHGSQSLLATAVCLLLSLAVIYLRIIGPGAQAISLKSGALAIILCAAILPVLQLIPLPAKLWTSLAGRELTIATLQAAGLPLTTPLPLTFDTLATIAAALHVLPTLAMFVAVYPLRSKERELLLQTLIAAALLSFVTLVPSFRALVNSAFGAASGADFSGFFANRNHQADLLLIATASVACLYVTRQRRSITETSLSLLLAGALLVGTLATLSRMALALVPLVLALSVLLVWQCGPHNRKASLFIGGGLLVALIAWGATLYILPRLMERLALQSQELRFREWPDILWAIRQYLPWGSGIGTFDQAFRTAEQLNGLAIEYMNEAHNEYLQVLLEGGLPGALLILLALVWYVRHSVRAWLARDPFGELASIVILIYLIHSLVDYPLRTISHAALLGTFAALLEVRTIFPGRMTRGVGLAVRS